MSGSHGWGGARCSVGEEQVRRGGVGGRRGGVGLAPCHEVRRGVRGRRQCARRQLLLHGALLYVVAELGRRHAVGAFAARLQLSAAELGLRERGRGEGERLRAKRRRGGEGRRGRGGGGGRRLHGPEALRLGVECARHLQSQLIPISLDVALPALKFLSFLYTIPLGFPAQIT